MVINGPPNCFATFMMLANRVQGRAILAIVIAFVLLVLLYIYEPRRLFLDETDEHLIVDIPNEHPQGHTKQHSTGSQIHPPQEHGQQHPHHQLEEQPPPVSLEQPQDEPPPLPIVQPTHHRLQLVVASTKSENTEWVHQHFSDWNPQIYVVDDKKAALTVPKNKGREAMVYLTHVINNYDSLPDTTVFIHASRFAWHNDDPDYDAVPTLRNLQLRYVRENGYVNLRCVWVIGCPSEIRPFIDEGHHDDDGKSSAKGIYKSAFAELWPETPVPKQVAVSCCSQFAVTRETIQKRPLADYVGYRDWLTETEHSDDLSGRVMEFSWHIMFGKEAVHCPSAQACYCNVFGICNMTCTDSSCDGRYVLPKSSRLPDGWPLKGWDHEDRNYTAVLLD